MRACVRSTFLKSILHLIASAARAARRVIALTGSRPHAYKAAAVAEARTPMRLISRRFVIVESKVRLAGRQVDADGVADECEGLLALAALAKLRALGLVLAIELLIS